MHSARNWTWAVCAWTCVIFFSSTSLAEKWADASFGFLSNVFLHSFKEHTTSYNLVHLVADKGFHVTLFCVLAMLLWLALGSNDRKVWIILGTGAFIGSCSEFLQRFFPDRDPALRDVLINTGGTALGIILCLLIAKMFSRPNPVA